MKNVTIILAVYAIASAGLISGCSTTNLQDLMHQGADLADSLPVQSVPAVVPDNESTPAEDLQADGFLWEPSADHVRIVIPASLPHWQLHLFTLSTHHTIYGPDTSGRGRAGDIEYILQGSGADWAALASATCPKGYPSIMVYINTVSPQSTGHASAGWRILDPSQRVTGDRTNRLQPGQNK